MPGDTKKFVVGGGDNKFDSRTSDIFGCLDTIAAKHEAVEKVRGDSDKKGHTGREDQEKTHGSRDYEQDEHSGSHDHRGEHPIPKPRNWLDVDREDPSVRSTGSGAGPSFNQPRVPPWRQPRKSPYRTPEHHRHPERWTKYDLSDVSEMSDKANSSAALAFLGERKRMQEEGSMETEDCAIEAKPAFRKVSKEGTTAHTDTAHTDTAHKSQHASGMGGPAKFVMPEYVVGQSSKPKARRTEATRTVTCESSNSVKIDHLLEEEEMTKKKKVPTATLR